MVRAGLFVSKLSVICYFGNAAQPSPMPTTITFGDRAKSAESTRPRAAVATLASFDSNSFGGTIVVQDTLSGIEVFGTITGADASNLGTGKFYVGAGFSCDSTSLAGTAYYAQKTSPWETARYSPNSFRISLQLVLFPCLGASGTRPTPMDWPAWTGPSMD